MATRVRLNLRFKIMSIVFEPDQKRFEFQIFDPHAMNDVRNGDDLLDGRRVHHPKPYHKWTSSRWNTSIDGF